MKLAAADEASTAAEAVPSASPGLAAKHSSGTLRTRFCAVCTATTWCVFLVLLRGGVDTHQRIVSLHMHLHQNESAVLPSNKTYWGEEDWRIPPSPPPGVPKLDRDGCFTKLHQQNYTVVAKCGRPNNVRPQPAQPDEVLHILPGCVFTTDSRCCAKADGAVWDLRNSANLGINAAQLADFRSARPKQIWVAESTETYQSISTGTRPLGDSSIMKLMDYAAYFGISADFPLLPNYDYRNEVYRDLIAWPGRNVPLRTAQPLQVLLRGKKGDILYLSSDCVTAHGSKRDRFVSNVFMSHLKVDSLGKCVRTTQKQYDKHSSATNFRASSAAMIASYRFRLVIPRCRQSELITLHERYSSASEMVWMPPGNHLHHMHLLRRIHHRIPVRLHETSRVGAHPCAARHRRWGAGRDTVEVLLVVSCGLAIRGSGHHHMPLWSIL
eukprot:COSAG01_NODE_7167_length_3322_cov_2.671114_1_plen_439_part_00